jgi:hypothetical protein
MARTSACAAGVVDRRHSILDMVTDSTCGFAARLGGDGRSDSSAQSSQRSQLSLIAVPASSSTRAGFADESSYFQTRLRTFLVE